MKGLMFITFGQEHRHNIHGSIFDKDCIAVIQCDNHNDGRIVAFECFGPKFCFSYFNSEFEFTDMKYYPRGFISVNF